MPAKTKSENKADAVSASFSACISVCPARAGWLPPMPAGESSPAVPGDENAYARRLKIQAAPYIQQDRSELG
jgi:hypothetical protein